MTLFAYAINYQQLVFRYGFYKKYIVLILLNVLIWLVIYNHFSVIGDLTFFSIFFLQNRAISRALRSLLSDKKFMRSLS